MPSRAALASLLLVLLSGTSAAADPAAPCPTLQVLPRGDGTIVLLGERALETGPVTELATAGCGLGNPQLRLRWTRDGEGRWTGAGRLPEGLEGRFLVHRERLWTAAIAETTVKLGGPSLSLAPLGGNGVTDAWAVPELPGARAFAVESLDRWSVAIAQGLDDGGLSLEVLTSHGPHEQFERTLLVDAPAAWPEGSRLLGLGGRPERVVLFGRDRASRLLALEVTETELRALPPFQVTLGAEARGLVLDGVPAWLVRLGGGLSLLAHDDGAWSEWSSTELPPSESWDAAAVDGGLALASWDGERLRAWSWSASGGWRAETVPEGVTEALVHAPTGAPAPRPTRSRVLPMALALGAALVGAALSLRLLRGR